jgi:NAD(P)H-flavin reductase
MATPSKISALVEQVMAHGDRTYSVFFRPEGRLPRFKAGQFLHLALDEYEPSQHWPDSRVFSIASAPGELPLRLTFSVVGRFSGRMENELKPGARVWLKLPYGEFVVEPAPHIVLVAGGTGISPYIPFLSAWAAQPQDASRVTLLYGVRTPGLFIFRDVVERCRAARPQFQVCLKSETPGATDPAVQTGRLSLADVGALCPQPADDVFYLSGPPGMLEFFKRGLPEQLGVLPAQIRVDAWS